jgi:flagellar hook-associated protein 1 FlgK
LKRQSLSGVSLDDEATDLVRWQQSFQAAAQFMRTVNQVTETALSILGG